MTTTTQTIELEALSHTTILTPIISKKSLEIANNATTAEDGPSTPYAPSASTLKITLTIFQPSLVNFVSSFATAIITVGLPVIARDIDLPRSLYLWPSSVFGLTSGAMLLIAGAITDIVGARIVEQIGILFLGVFTLACGLSTTGVQLVVFRALQGIAMAMHLPASVALIAGTVPSGRSRNVGFACLGLSQTLGFAFGLVLSGIMIQRSGWRSGFYLCGGANLLAAVASLWLLPKVNPGSESDRTKLQRILDEIDWVGGIISGGGLAILAYVLAILSADLSTIRSADTISLLSVSIVLLVAFPIWMHYRERAAKPALVPNSLWKNLPFASTCIMVVLSYGVVNSMELFSSLYFQEVQNATTLTTSLQLLPSLVVGTVLNLGMGLFIHRISVRWLVTVSSFLCALAPLMMALVDPAWQYWYLEFWAQVFAPMSVDVLFTIGLIIVSENFPEKTQALAGAVFSTVSQFGLSLGVGSCQVVALGVMGKNEGTEGGDGVGHSAAFEGMDAVAILRGYRASFWTMFAYMILCGLIAVVGLRKAGKIGLKRE
ncbi:major facilitator superfamily domain-containing protein [Massariosphaeria phaeospora]|uniref:Major facilitator superfamily domain-containing protein n=1 Tax=Massariosphaeria phaeospora TaxID=100035 RepID=A0A7C8IGG5_9PLEO|nr:major facilitator superfamily domain-containing protein [Massariosphaeria phaeospora]